MTDFINYHLAIEKDAFFATQWAVPRHLPANMQIESVWPTYPLYQVMLDRVGGPWGWNRRPKYLDRKAVQERLDAPDTELFVLRVDGRIVGYTLVTHPNDAICAQFAPRRVIEIENYGLFLNETGKGYGKIFLPAIFSLLLKTNDVVYLSSRSTNHAKVIAFYQRLGMQIIKTETLPDDLVATETATAA